MINRNMKNKKNRYMKKKIMKMKTLIKNKKMMEMISMRMSKL